LIDNNQGQDTAVFTSPYQTSNADVTVATLYLSIPCGSTDCNHAQCAQAERMAVQRRRNRQVEHLEAQTRDLRAAAARLPRPPRPAPILAAPDRRGAPKSSHPAPKPHWAPALRRFAQR
jgi:hypothetical protein